jgi:hypothetical protein
MAKGYLEADVCRRILLDQHMDGRQDRLGCELGEAKCDLCEVQPRGTKHVAEEEKEEPLVPASPAREREALERAMAVEQQRIELRQRRRAEQVVYELERLDQFLQRWSYVCAICMATRADASQHAWKRCPRASAAQMASIEEEVKMLYYVKWDKYTRCLYCWAP